MIGHDSQSAYSDDSSDQLLDSPGSPTGHRRSHLVPVGRAVTTSSRLSIDAKATNRATEHALGRGPQGWTDPARLTPRETEVLGWMARGLTNAGIAKRLFVSTKTVELHVARIFDKLGLHEQWGTNRRVVAVIRWLNQEG